MIMYDHVTNAPLVPTMAFSPSPESNASYSPPLTRDSSPCPSISPNSATSTCPPLSRSFSANSSTTSSVSTGSQPSITSRSVSASGAVRQRGYVRPQGVSFAPSAGNRESVLSLGSIAHLQYYFARTGLLDGKGGQLAKESKNKQVNLLLRPAFCYPNLPQMPRCREAVYKPFGLRGTTHAATNSQHLQSQSPISPPTPRFGDTQI